jgi:hypothetical protein
MVVRIGLTRNVKTEEYLCGFAAALAAFHRWCKEPEKVAAVMEGEGIDYMMLKKAGADIEDLTEIGKCIRER